MKRRSFMTVLAADPAEAVCAGWPQASQPGLTDPTPEGGRSIHKAVELCGVLADDLVPGGSGQMTELLLDVFL